MLAKSLEKILNDLFQKAGAEGVEFVGMEHLLRALLSDSECRDVLAAAGAKIEQIEGALDRHIASRIISADSRRHSDVQPTIGFQRTLQRAVFHVQASGRKEVGSIDVLLPLFHESESPAVRILAEHGIERKDLLRQLGEADRNDNPTNICTAAGVAGSEFGATQSDIQKRLDAIEAKLDETIGEVRDVSAKLAQLIERLPPND